jgi:hypothetical protein
MCGFHCFDQCVLKVRIRDKRIVSVEPDGIDLRGSANMLTHDVDLPESVIGPFHCKGLVEINKYDRQKKFNS